MAAVRIFETDWGWVGAAATARGLVRVVLPGRRNRPALRNLECLAGAEPDAPAEAHAGRAEREIREYLGRRRKAFTVPPDLSGLRPFQRKVLRATRKIPYGKTVTYGELAARVGNRRAARAVGRAMARNPVPLVVPCHRVVGGGGLGGFGGGEVLKRRLLSLEERATRSRRAC